MNNVQALILLQILIAFQCAVFTLFLLTRRRGRQASNLALGVFLGLLAVHMLTQAGQSAHLIGQGLQLPQLFGFLYPPLFYLYVTGLLYREIRFRARLLFHLAPFVAAVSLWWMALLPLPLEALGIFTSFGCYLWAAFLSLRRFQNVLENTRSNAHSLRFRWLSFAIYAMAVVYALDIFSFLLGFVADWPQAWAVEGIKYVLILVYVNAFVFSAFEYPQLFRGIDTDDAKLAAVPSTVNQREASPDDRDDAERIEKYMKDERPYLQPELTLAELAQQLGMAPRRLSEVINLCFKKNFSDFTNDYRVEAAKLRLTAPERRDENILDVLFSTGFNSKSSFNSIFKRKTGLSPSQYRRQHRR